MSNIEKLNHENYLMAFVVINEDDANNFVKEAIKIGLEGGMVVPAKGLIDSLLLNRLAIRQRKYRVILMFDKKSILEQSLDTLSQKFHFDKPNHGVIFTLNCHYELHRDFPMHFNLWEEANTYHQLLYTTFRHGRREEFIKTMKELGATGSTIFTGSGQFTLEQSSMFGMKIFPQKDTLLTVISPDNIHAIYQGLDKYFNICETKGIKLHSLDIRAFSGDQTMAEIAGPNSQLSMLISIITEDLLDDYIEMTKNHQISSGTMIKGYGTADEEKVEKYFNMSVDPQKLIIFSVAETEKIDQTYLDIINDKNLMAPFQSVFFTLPIHSSYGLNLHRKK